VTPPHVVVANRNAPRPTEPLRVAVLVESFTVPEWVKWTLEQLDALAGCDLAAVVPSAGASDRPAVPRGFRHLTYRLYERADARVFGAAPALAPADVSWIAAGRTGLAGIDALDVVVSFLPVERTAWAGPVPRHGLWAIVPMDEGRTAGAPDRFWELHRGSETGATAVVALVGGRARVIARAAARADPLSLGRRRNSGAWESARLVLHSLRRLGCDAGGLLPGDDLADPSEPPSPAVTVAHTARTVAHGAAARGRTAWRREEWFVAVRERSADGRVRGPLRALPNPPGRYLGDPFPIEVGGRHYLFVEDYSRAAGRASIAVLEAADDGTWSPPRTVLECGHHLSYPFVFEHGRAIYMLPETGEAGRVELHRALEFPGRWELDRVLLDGLTAVDATLHVDGDRLWLFANVVEGPGDRGELWLYSAASLDGKWRPHPRNPVVTDPGRARPAGRLFIRDGVLVRPGQDGSRRYGGAVVLNRVDLLSPSEYRETPMERIEPDWMPGLVGTHTYTFDSRYECLDGIRRVRRLRIRR
jgi:hypothetical protein